MTRFRIALANLRFPSDGQDAVRLACRGVEEAASGGASLVCFPECFVPGYRRPEKAMPPLDTVYLERAWSEIAVAAASRRIVVILGTERSPTSAGPGDSSRVELPVASALVIGPEGSRLGFQDKVQLDPSEEETYTPGADRRVFQVGALTFGIAICHEGWRYPETVRWAARRGAQVVFHPQFHEAEAGAFRPTTFCDPRNTFHEKALLCRAAENTCYVATTNYASAGSPTTSAVVGPDGTVLAYQPYGEEGVLIADLDLQRATRLLATRYKPIA